MKHTIQRFDSLISQSTRRPRILFAAMLIIPILALSGCQTRGDRLISQTLPLSEQPLSAFGWVGVHFTEPMDQTSVEGAFSISPFVKGETFWQENSFWFRPIAPFSQDTVYKVQLAGEIETANGRMVLVDRAWEFTIRQPDLIYFVPMGEGGEVWRAGADGSNSHPLSATGGKVIEFAPDRSGSQITFSVKNEAGGRDLWLMDRDGENQRLLLNCGEDVCGDPAWSMDRERIAYTREVHDPDSGGYQPAQVWTVDVKSAQTSQLYQGEIAFCHSPSFSPDGKKLATYDTTQNAIQVLNLQTSQESGIPRVLPGAGDWSPDSEHILFTDLLAAENEPFVEIYIADLEKGTVETALIEPTTDTDFSQPRWSPAGDWLAAALRPVNANITKALWLLPLGDGVPISVADDPAATYSAYQWDPWGESLVYQRFALSGSEPVSIWRWDWDSRQAVKILDAGARPQWLP
jgi:WD40 repeat protein